MSYQHEREDFIARMTQEGLPLDVTRLLLREATGFNRRAELACSSEAADRDRVPCPASKTHNPNDCLCDVQPSRESVDYLAEHELVTRISVQDWRAEERIRKAFVKVNIAINQRDIGKGCTREPFGVWKFMTAGDPRGYTLRVIPPSYAARNQGKDRFNRDSIGVPAGPSRIRW